MSQGAATDTVAFVDAVRARQLAARHTASLVLGVHAAAVALLAGVEAARMHMVVWVGLVPVAVYLVLWVVVRIRARRTGMGAARDGFGVAAALTLALALFLPLSFVLYFLAGAGVVLGLGLVVIGVRLRLPSLWTPGLVLMLLSPLVQLGVLDGHAKLLGPRPGTMALGLFALALAVLAVAAARAERATLRLPPP